MRQVNKVSLNIIFFPCNCKKNNNLNKLCYSRVQYWLGWIMIEQIMQIFLLNWCIFIFSFDLHVKQFRTSILSYYYEKAHKSCVNLDVGVLIRLITFSYTACFIWHLKWNNMLPLMYKPRNVQNAMKTTRQTTPRTIIAIFELNVDLPRPFPIQK